MAHVSRVQLGHVEVQKAFQVGPSLILCVGWSMLEAGSTSYFCKNYVGTT